MAPPVSAWGKCFQLAKAAIEKHVDEHHRFVSSQNNPFADHVPSLVDLAAQRLADFSFEDSDSLNDIPPIILDSYIWKWHKIAYPAFRRGVLRLSCASDLDQEQTANSIKDVDEWILSNERWLRDGNHSQWHHGLVTLGDADSVFPNSTAGARHRTIIRPKSPLPGFELLCDGREPHITIQPSVEAFKRTFEHMSDGLLKGLDWNNVVVAGGFVLGTLLSVDAPDGEPHRDPRWSKSDIDVYIYGLSPSEANEKVLHLFEIFSANLPAGTQTLVVRNCSTITFYARYPLRRIQIVLKLVESPKAVLLNFDLDVCAMGWDGATFWMLPRAARALEMGCGVFTMDLVNGHYLSNRRASTQERIFKYADKGYGIRILPSYITSLATREAASDTNKPRNPVPSARKCLDLASVAAEEREWTTQELANSTLEYGRPPPLRALISRGYRASRCLNGFQIFMRCVALWEHGRRGDVSIEKDFWASTGYQDAMTTYDDAPPTLQYKWDEDFDVSEFHDYIDEANATEIANWTETDFDQRLLWHGVSVSSSDDGLDAYQRMTCAPTVDAVLSKKNDIMLQVLLPCNFAVYANDLVSRAQDQAGLPETKLLMPAVRGFNFLWNPNPRADGLFFWRIGKDLMWQKLDRRVDEVFEVLYAFRRVNEQLRDGDAYQASRFREELARRVVYDEFDAFALWVQTGVCAT
ncbi:hypothetical protein DFH06DRAFT_1180734 [Mycena polygramma]|nr:hypothetical protein DFH06DRAFT_1180734 [Mycena polygramma]